MHLKWHIKKMYILRGEIPIKCLKKINFRNKLKGFFSGHNKLILRSNSLLPNYLKFMCFFKDSHFYTQQVSKTAENPPPPKKIQFFSFYFVLLISQLFSRENILNFYHGLVCQRPFKFHIRNRRKLFVIGHGHGHFRTLSFDCLQIKWGGGGFNLCAARELYCLLTRKIREIMKMAMNP